MKTTNALGVSCRLFGWGVSLLAVVATRASTDVTFTIDMSPTGVTPAAVYINGSFNGWGTPGSPVFTNNGANVWSQTVTITDAPGTVENCKFWYDNNWENDPNRQFLLGSGTQVLPATSWNVKDWPQNTNQVTFQVDLSAQVINGAFVPGETVAVAGDFENWDNSPTPGPFFLTNNPTLPDLSSNIYRGTFPVPGFPPTTINYKFRANGGWESPASTGGNNRQATITNSAQVLPVVYYNDTPPSAPTNYVTFQVDMSAQVLLGNFTNGDPSSSITVAGGFEGDNPGYTSWDSGLPLTNNPTLGGNASNVYSGTFMVIGTPPWPIRYKFRMNGGWEGDQATASKNREATITNANQVLPLVYYNNNTVYDLLPDPVTVTFTLYMTNGTVDKNGYAFDNQNDTLWINGDFLNNWNGNSWPGPIGSFPSAQQMIEVGTSDYYTNSFVLPRGSSVYLNYKYSIDSSDDENGFQTNHVREVRSYGPDYLIATDRWSWTVVQPGIAPYPNPGITTTNIVEPDFGYLTIQPQLRGAFPITWLGRPGVVLENATNLTSGGWNINTGSDGTQATNWPNTSNSQFFRLMKKQ